MTLQASLITAAILIAIAIFCGWRGARLPNPHKGPRLIPWRVLMMISTAVAVLLLLHAGVEVGFFKAQ